VSAQVDTAPLSHFRSPQAAQITVAGYQVRYQILGRDTGGGESNPRFVPAALPAGEFESRLAFRLEASGCRIVEPGAHIVRIAVPARACFRRVGQVLIRQCRGFVWRTSRLRSEVWRR
jgi:hypothetical protein